MPHEIPLSGLTAGRAFIVISNVSATPVHTAPAAGSSDTIDVTIFNDTAGALDCNISDGAASSNINIAADATLRFRVTLALGAALTMQGSGAGLKVAGVVSRDRYTA